jgi:hypothetical protein
MNYINMKLKETAFSISIKHIIKNKNLSYKKMAERIITLYIELFDLENCPTIFNLEALSNYLENLESIDELKIIQWLHSNHK